MSKIVMVHWNDSSSRGGRVWNSAEDLSKDRLCPCISVGHLVHEDKHSVTIAGHAAADGADYAGSMKIPKAAITKRKVVRP